MPDQSIPAKRAPDSIRPAAPRSAENTRACRPSGSTRIATAFAEPTPDETTLPRKRRRPVLANQRFQKIARSLVAALP